MPKTYQSKNTLVFVYVIYGSYTVALIELLFIVCIPPPVI